MFVKGTARVVKPVTIRQATIRVDGSVTIPEALRPYMGGRERITAKGA